MWSSVDIPWSPQGTVIQLSMKGKTNPSIMERQCRAGIHSGMAPLQPEGWAGAWMVSGRVIGNLCVRSVLRTLQPLFTAAVCRRLAVLGTDWSEALKHEGAEEGKKHRRGDRKLLQTPSHPWEGTQTFLPPSSQPTHMEQQLKQHV